MTKTSTTAVTFSVDVFDGANNHRVRVATDTRSEAPAAALEIMVQGAKAYNVKYASTLPAWAIPSEVADTYTTGTVRKIAARR